jgi:NlpC/P60 family putative phage cell wall peptidase
MTRTAVVEIARSWIGTPYIHQASAKGSGTDCLGLLRGVWREIYGAEPAEVPPYSADWSEVSRTETLLEAAKCCLATVTEETMLPGDVLLFRMRDHGVAKHLGIVGSVRTIPTFIHAYSGHCVVESPLSQPWAKRIVARFRFPSA